MFLVPERIFIILGMRPISVEYLFKFFRDFQEWMIELNLKMLCHFFKLLDLELNRDFTVIVLCLNHKFDELVDG